jgi:hypothetical protein
MNNAEWSDDRVRATLGRYDSGARLSLVALDGPFTGERFPLPHADWVVWVGQDFGEVAPPGYRLDLEEPSEKWCGQYVYNPKEEALSWQELG